MDNTIDKMTYVHCYGRELRVSARLKQHSKLAVAEGALRVQEVGSGSSNSLRRAYLGRKKMPKNLKTTLDSLTVPLVNASESR